MDRLQTIRELSKIGLRVPGLSCPAADARDLLQGLATGVEHPLQRAEALQEFLRQGLHILTGKGIKEDELQDLVILKAGDSRPFEPGLQPVAVSQVLGVVDGHRPNLSHGLSRWGIWLRLRAVRSAGARSIGKKPVKRSRTRAGSGVFPPVNVST